MKILNKIREENGVANLMWIVLGALIAAAVIGVIAVRVFGGSKDPSNGDYTKYLGDGNKILNVDEIKTAQNKFVNGGSEKSDWKPSANIIADQWTGKKDAKVIVEQYEDFACSACTAFEPSAEKIYKDYENKSVAFVYRNFSIGQPTSILSQASAQAAYVESGNNMNIFWDMVQKIFQGQKCVEGSAKDTCQKAIDGYVKDLGLNKDKFDDLVANFATNGIQDKLNRDKNLGLAANINATPTWIISGPNGTKTVSGSNDSDMRSAIDEALKSVN